MLTIEEVLVLASRNDLLPVLEHFIKNEGNLHFIINEGGQQLNLLNIAAEEGSLNVLNYLLDNEFFTVDQKASANTQTAFHSAVEGNQIEAAKLLLSQIWEKNHALAVRRFNI